MTTKAPSAPDMGDTVQKSFKFLINTPLAIAGETFDAILRPLGVEQDTGDIVKSLGKAPGEDAARAQDRLSAQRERERRQINERARASVFKKRQISFKKQQGLDPNAGTLDFGEIKPLQDTLKI